MQAVCDGTVRGEDLIVTPNGMVFLPAKKKKGVLPRLLKEILDTRIMIKKQMKTLDPEQRALMRSRRSLFCISHVVLTQVSKLSAIRIEDDCECELWIYCSRLLWENAHGRARRCHCTKRSTDTDQCHRSHSIASRLVFLDVSISPSL